LIIKQNDEAGMPKKGWSVINVGIYFENWLPATAGTTT